METLAYCVGNGSDSSDKKISWPEEHHYLAEYNDKYIQ